MATYLITGRGGTGKTTLARELQQLGYAAFDGDEVPGLAQAEDLATGQPVEVDWSGFVDFSKIGWNWQRSALEKLLRRADNPVFLCGSASNQLEFHPLFKQVFVLTLDPKTHAERLQKRESAYGKNQRMQQAIIREQKIFTKEALALGGVEITAGQPLAEIVKEILGHVANAR